MKLSKLIDNIKILSEIVHHSLFLLMLNDASIFMQTILLYNFLVCLTMFLVNLVHIQVIHAPKLIYIYIYTLLIVFSGWFVQVYLSMGDTFSIVNKLTKNLL